MLEETKDVKYGCIEVAFVGAAIDVVFMVSVVVMCAFETVTRSDFGGQNFINL